MFASDQWEPSIRDREDDHPHRQTFRRSWHWERL
jgi:hypothetical protein